MTVQISYDHAVKLQCCIKIGKSEKIVLFGTLWAIDFYNYVEHCVVYTKKLRMYRPTRSLRQSARAKRPKS